MTDLLSRLSPWIISNGGPLILLAMDNLLDWEGTDPPSNGRIVEADFRFNFLEEPDAPATDYDRACDVDEHLAIFEVGSGQGVIFTGKRGTAWFRTVDGNRGGILIRDSADDDPALLAVVESLPEEAWQTEAFTLEFSQGPLTLFDSAYPGSLAQGYPGSLAQFDQHLVIDLLPGRYTVATAEALGYHTLHRFTNIQNDKD